MSLRKKIAKWGTDIHVDIGVRMGVEEKVIVPICTKKHMKKEQKKYKNTSATEDENKNGSGKDESEKDLKCQLCNEVLDDNDDMKKHYIIQHMAHLKKIGGWMWSWICMELQEDSCSQFCFYYKNLFGFEVKET